MAGSKDALTPLERLKSSHFLNKTEISSGELNYLQLLWRNYNIYNTYVAAIEINSFGTEQKFDGQESNYLQDCR